MNMKHTPGPWKQFRDSRGNVRIHGNVQGGPIAFVEELDNTGGTEQDHANARRIVECVNACEGIADPTAVPELLDCLQRAYAALRGMYAANGAADLFERSEPAQRYRAAIAKATGETI